MKRKSQAHDDLFRGIAAGTQAENSQHANATMCPTDWDVLPLRSLGRCVSGGTPRLSDRRLWNGDVPWVSSKDMKVSRISDSIDHVTELATTRGTRLVQPGTLLIVVRGMSLLHSLPVALVVRPVTFNQDLKAFVPAPDVNPEFLLAWFQAAEPRLLLLATEATHGTKRLPTNDLLAAQVCVPPREEQDAIAEVLADADRLLDALDSLIAKKRAIKQGSMQQLLTGKTRLPGFTGKWETRKLGELGHFLKGRGVTKDQALSGTIPCVRYGELYTHHNDYIRQFYSRVAPEVAAGATRLETGDILFAGSGETKEDIGKAVAFVDTCEAYAGGDIVILRLTEGDPRFLGYLCNTSAVNTQKASKGQGDAVVHISSSSLASVAVKLPAVQEQSAIVAVIADMDAEIEALERRSNKVRQIKQGIMQELLTGRIRLVKPQALSVTAPTEEDAKTSKPHSWAFNEAVVISTLAKHFGKEEFPLGRKRYTKLSYLLHRHVERRAEGYLKKAAGPYNPKTKYGGPERIALENGYIREHKHGAYAGFVAGDNIAQAEAYFEKWYGPDAIKWLNQFRFKKNDDLELLATVDMAAEELRAAGKTVGVEVVKDVIKGHPEWQAKLDRPVFSDANIAGAIRSSSELFGASGRAGP